MHLWHYNVFTVILTKIFLLNILFYLCQQKIIIMTKKYLKYISLFFQNNAFISNFFHMYSIIK